jgi:hypothetical protein
LWPRTAAEVAEMNLRRSIFIVVGRQDLPGL